MIRIGKKQFCVALVLAFFSGALLGLLASCQSSLAISPSMFSLVERAQQLFRLSAR